MNIYIGNLNYRVREEDLKQVMEEYGVVDSVKIIIDRETGKSKGFAFVEMPHAREAVKAIKALNTLRLHGHGIRVKAAEDKPASK